MLCILLSRQLIVAKLDWCNLEYLIHSRFLAAMVASLSSHICHSVLSKCQGNYKHIVGHSNFFTAMQGIPDQVLSWYRYSPVLSCWLYRHSSVFASTHTYDEVIDPDSAAATLLNMLLDNLLHCIWRPVHWSRLQPEWKGSIDEHLPLPHAALNSQDTCISVIGIDWNHNTCMVGMHSWHASILASLVPFSLY